MKTHGMKIIEPASGRLACGDTGAGKMPEPEILLEWIKREIAYEKDLLGKKILISAGPTQETIDPVRYITNHSTGKMGYALAENAMLRGAEVTLVSGPVSIEPPLFTDVVPVTSAREMAEAIKSRAEKQDIIIMTAAVADYRPTHPADEKIKKSIVKTTHADEKTDLQGKLQQESQNSTKTALTIELEQTEDILSYLGRHKKPEQFLCGFSMETEHMLENSREKLKRKRADMIVANSLRTEGAGFGTDTNVVTLITRESCRELPLMSKAEVAGAILDEINVLIGK